MEQLPLGNIASSHFLRKGKIMGSKCCSCGAISVPPRPICNECLGGDLEWIELKGKGKLESFTCTAVCPPFMVEGGYSTENPYCVGVVELEEGSSVVALINGVDVKQPESIELGMSLEAKFTHLSEINAGEAFLVFGPA